MAAVAYLDASALIKLMVRDDETSSLEADLAERPGVITSHLSEIECRRTARRSTSRRVLQTASQVLEAVYLLPITPAIIDTASEIEPPLVRSLDAIHLATALSIDDPGLEVITYDSRMADAARANGLRVLQPGR